MLRTHKRNHTLQHTQTIQTEKNYEYVNMPTWIITALKKCVFLFVCLRVHRYIMSETAEPWADVDTQTLFVKALFLKQVTTPPRE